MAEMLGYNETVYWFGIKKGEIVDINTDNKLLEWCASVPPSNARVVVLYLQQSNTTPLSVEGPCVRNISNEFNEEEATANEHCEEGATAYEEVYVEDSSDEESVEEHVEENVDESDEEESSDTEFINSDYEQSDVKERLLENYDRVFDNYVDHNVADTNPNAHEDKGDGFVDVAISDLNSLDSSNGKEVKGPVKRRNWKLPKFEDFRPETDLRNPCFKVGLMFPTV